MIRIYSTNAHLWYRKSWFAFTVQMHFLLERRFCYLSRWHGSFPSAWSLAACATWIPRLAPAAAATASSSRTSRRSDASFVRYRWAPPAWSISLSTCSLDTLFCVPCFKWKALKLWIFLLVFKELARLIRGWSELILHIIPVCILHVDPACRLRSRALERCRIPRSSSLPPFCRDVTRSVDLVPCAHRHACHALAIQLHPNLAFDTLHSFAPANRIFGCAECWSCARKHAPSNASDAAPRQHELCVLAQKFRNLHIYGCWWVGAASMPLESRWHVPLNMVIFQTFWFAHRWFMLWLRCDEILDLASLYQQTILMGFALPGGLV